jgi:hypothetical protein
VPACVRSTCQTATVLTTTLQRTTIGHLFSGQRLSPQFTDPDDWLVWTAPNNGTFSVSALSPTCNLAMAMYTDCNTIYAVDYGNPVSFDVCATMGERYYFQVACDDELWADYEVEMQPSAAPCTQPSGWRSSCPTAQPRLGLGLLYDDDNEPYDFSGQSGTGCGMWDRPDLWFNWTAPSTGPFDALLGNTVCDGVLALWSSCSELFVCKDDGVAGEGSDRITFCAVQGQSYLFQAGAHSTPVWCRDDLFVEISVSEECDECSVSTCATAELLLLGQPLANTTRCQSSSGRALPSGIRAPDDWYRWTAPSTGVYLLNASVELSYEGPICNMILGVYSSCSTAPIYRSNSYWQSPYAVDPEVVFQATGGTPYWLQIGCSSTDYANAASYTLSINTAPVGYTLSPTPTAGPATTSPPGQTGTATNPISNNGPEPTGFTNTAPATGPTAAPSAHSNPAVSVTLPPVIGEQLTLPYLLLDASSQLYFQAGGMLVVTGAATLGGTITVNLNGQAVSDGQLIELINCSPCTGSAEVEIENYETTSCMQVSASPVSSASVFSLLIQVTETCSPAPRLRLHPLSWV